MLYPVVFLGAFPVVKSLQRSNQIAGDPANSLKRLMTEVIGQFHIITIYLDVDTNRLAPILLFRSLDIGIDLSLLQLSTSDRDMTSHTYFLHISAVLCERRHFSLKCHVKHSGTHNLCCVVIQVHPVLQGFTRENDWHPIMDMPNAVAGFSC